jgi:hypothetical protein
VRKVRLMGVAFAMAVVTLQQRRRNDPLRDSVAHKIIELAKALVNATRSDSVTGP